MPDLLRRSYLLTEEKARGLEVYRDSAAMLGEFCIERWVWKTIFPAETRLVLAFLAETKLPVKYRAPIVRDSLFTHSMHQTWTPIIEGLEPGEFAALCTVSGAEHVAAARAAGRGILIVLVRTIFSDVLQNWLRRQGIAARYCRSWNTAQSDRNPVSDAGGITAELPEARDTLRQGGVVLLFGDTEMRSGIEVAFWNRRRAFSPAFGRLALETKALALTASVRLAEDGQIRVEIGPPFDYGSSEQTPSEALKNLVLQYVARASRFWRQYPASLSWADMRAHLDLPSITPQPAQGAPGHTDSSLTEAEAAGGVTDSGS